MKSSLKKPQSYYKNFVLERFLSVITFALMFTLLALLARLGSFNYLNIVLFLSNPLNVSLVIIAFGFAVLYSLEVIKVILIDYVPNGFARLLSIYLLKSLAFALYILLVVSVLFLGV